ncbi:MAG: hypothetical protein NC819_00290 [Candidatus Omnitrophica bacterium]|nr:hypothetical protein [Candidatus Omnitrophota bacterium]
MDVQRTHPGSVYPWFVVFNGRAGSLTREGVLKAETGERVGIYFGNAGPNLISEPAHSIQTTLVPAGGASVVEFGVEVPGTYTLVDHAIFRIGKGPSGF